MPSPKLKLRPHSAEHHLFESTFDVKLNDLFDLYGLDVVKLDEVIGTPEGESLEGFIERRTSPAVVEYVRRLI